MPKPVKVELNLAGFRALRTSPEVLADLEARGRKIAEAAGEGYEMVNDIPGKNRGRVTVMPVTLEAVRAEATDHNLLGAVDAGR